MQVRVDAAKDDGDAVAAARDARDVHGLSNVLGKVGDILDSLGALCGLGAVAAGELAHLCVAHTALEDLRLVGEGADDAAALGAVAVEVDVAELGRVVGAVDPVPVCRVAALAGAAVLIGPGGDAAEAAAGLGLEELGEDLLGLGLEELFRGVADLLVDWGLSV